METDGKLQANTSDAPSVGSLRWSLRFLFKVVLPLICVVAAVLVSVIMIKTGPKAKRQKPPQQARQVTVETLKRTDTQAIVHESGAVVPAQQTSLNPEVSGRVTAICPEVIPGGLIEQGQELVRIDSRDYETLVTQRGKRTGQGGTGFKAGIG